MFIQGYSAEFSHISTVLGLNNVGLFKNGRIIEKIVLSSAYSNINYFIRMFFF